VRRIAIVGAAFVGWLAFMAPSAFATFHLNMVSEVLLASGSGDMSVQFVELRDRGGTEETFPPVFGPYKLVVYDGAGDMLGQHALNANGLRAAAAAGHEYLVSTGAADAQFGVTGDERLDVTLPAGAGQVCYEAGTSSPSAYSCMTWGTITHAVPTNSGGTGSVHGPVPPNGESDQRQADNTVVAAPPTPKAPNRSAQAPSGGTGNGGGGSGGSTARGFQGVRLVDATARVRSGRTRLRLRCPRSSGGCTGRLTLTTRTAGHRIVTVAAARFGLAPGHTQTVDVVLTRAGRKLLSRRHRVEVHVVIVSHDRAHQSKRTSTSVRLVGMRR
jgi:hypothetical protein